MQEGYTLEDVLDYDQFGHTLVYFFLYFRVSNIPEDGAKIRSGACDSDQLLPPQTEPLET